MSYAYENEDVLFDDEDISATDQLSTPEETAYSEESDREPIDDDNKFPPKGKQKWKLEKTLNSDEGTGESTPSEGVLEGQLPRDRQRKTAYFDPSAEKHMTHMEAKQLFQRYQYENQNQAENLSPVLRAHTISSGTAIPKKSQPEKATSRPSSYSLSQSYTQTWSLPPNFETPSRGQRQEPVIVPPVDTSFDSDGDQNDHVDPFHQANAPLDVAFQRADSSQDHQRTPLTTITGQGPEARVPLVAGAGAFASSDVYVTSELTTIYQSIQRLLQLRHKYIKVAGQGSYDNPKDKSDWHIYPPPPIPVWDHTGQRMDHKKDINQMEVAPGSPKRSRKPGVDIGEDFDIDDLLPVPDDDSLTYRLDENGVYQVYDRAESEEPILEVPTLRDFYIDLEKILSVSSDGPSKSFAFRRLQYLEGQFNLYVLLNEYQEMADSKKVPHRDFYNVRKVDTHVHHSACMNQKHLLRFIKSKMKKCPKEEVLFRDGRTLTLEQVFESINLTAYDLSIDTLDMHAHIDSFHRFDKFNLKYNPIGESRLRTIFLKTDNYIKGRYLAEITKEVISDLESSKYQMVEWRISIYGRSINEWDNLAAWVVDNKLFSHNVRWLIQIPRLYDVYKASGLMEDFEQVVVNVFQPLFEVTKNPSSHSKLFIFLQRVVGFDSVDDESKTERRLYRKFPRAKDWSTKQNPPYSYWIYFLYANMASLNVWRKRRGFNTFLLRPHCGEAGDTDHLAAAVLCCHSISHGLLLRKVPLLQYIFYLDQIGIAMSPLSNNALFLAYERNPFPQYFRRGLNVSLSTDDPLQFSFTKEPLIEEYSVAAQIYKLSAVDMCELAKHSVEQSGFEHQIKQHWLGHDYHLPGARGNDVAKVNVPDRREEFRYEVLLQELQMIARYANTPSGQRSLSGSGILEPQSTISRRCGNSLAAPNSPSASIKSRSSITQLRDQTNLYRLPSAAFPAQAARVPTAAGYPSEEPVTTQLQHTGYFSNNTDGANSLSPWASAEPPGGEDSMNMPAGTMSHLDASEPKLFPGVVHRAEVVRRRSSIVQSRREDGDATLKRSGTLEGGEVIKESDGTKGEA